jgi:hypothetical protein
VFDNDGGGVRVDPHAIERAAWPRG